MWTVEVSSQSFTGKKIIYELEVFGMFSQHHLDDFTRSRIIGKIEEGQKVTDVAREFDIAHSVVTRLWKSFKITGMRSRRRGGGRVRSTTPAEDRHIQRCRLRKICRGAQIELP